MDPDRSPRRGAIDFRCLADSGFTQAVVGLETGWAELRIDLGKSGDLGQFIATVNAAKAGGLRCGVTVLVGPGGEPAVERHTAETAEAVERMALDPGDLVHLAPLDGVAPQPILDDAEARLRAALRRVTAAKVVPYRPRLFRYYA